jgi:hypothetical protein
MIKLLTTTCLDLSCGGGGSVYAAPSCEEILINCKANSPNYIPICESNYNAAVRTGGRWPASPGRLEKTCEVRPRQTRK